MNQFSLKKYKNCHLDRSAIILTCGPSLSEFDKEKMINFCKDKVVFTIKQAIKRYPDISNYHFFNDNNFCKYNTPAVKIASAISPEAAKRAIWKDQDIDIAFKISSKTWHIKDSISYENDFSRMMIQEGETSRQWGPGIMYETVLPFVIHTGIKKIYINGWDYTTIDGRLKHYYDEKSAKKHLINTGKNIGTMSGGEEKYLLRSTDYLFDFLKEKGIEIIIMSKCSRMSDKFERIYEL